MSLTDPAIAGVLVALVAANLVFQAGLWVRVKLLQRDMKWLKRYHSETLDEPPNPRADD